MADHDLRTFTAPTMAEALTKVKRELGKDAIIVHTRSFRVGGVLGVGGRAMVEIAASKDTGSVPAAPSRHRARASLRGERETPSPADRPHAGSEAGHVTPERVNGNGHTNDDDPARMLMEALGGVRSAPDPRPMGHAHRPKTDPIPIRPTNGSAVDQESQSPERVATARPQPLPTEAAPTVPTPDGSASELRAEINELRALVSRVLDATAAPSDDLPLPSAQTPSAPARTDAGLVERWIEETGLEPAWAEAVRAAVAGAELPVDRLRDEIRSCLAGRVRVDRVEPSELVGDGRPGIVALIGPTGVGKTTTLAKLAADWKLRRGLRVGLIATDTYRIAAVDQLRSYAGIIGLPMRVASTPNELRSAVESLEGCELILIDTAGRSQNDTDRLGQIRGTLDAASPDRTLLCVSLAAGARTVARTVDRFRALGPDGLVLTKLDEAESPGVATHAMASGLPVTHLTFGQEVPDDIEDVTSERIADAMVAGLVQDDPRAQGADAPGAEVAPSRTTAPGHGRPEIAIRPVAEPALR